jgi:hypothetical protein
MNEPILAITPDFQTRANCRRHQQRLVVESALAIQARPNLLAIEVQQNVLTSRDHHHQTRKPIQP